MFAIAVPQTVQLVETPWVDPALPPPPLDKPVEAPPVAGSVTFDHATEDVSTCRMTVAIGDKTWTHVFGVNSTTFLNTTYEDDKIRKAKHEARKKAEALVAEQRKKEQAEAEKAAKGELRTADDTTAADVAWTAPHDPFGAGAPLYHPETDPSQEGRSHDPFAARQPPFEPQTGQPNPLYHPEPG